MIIFDVSKDVGCAGWRDGVGTVAGSVYGAGEAEAQLFEIFEGGWYGGAGV